MSGQTDVHTDRQDAWTDRRTQGQPCRQTDNVDTILFGHLRHDMMIIRLHVNKYLKGTDTIAGVSNSVVR